LTIDNWQLIIDNQCCQVNIQGLKFGQSTFSLSGRDTTSEIIVQISEIIPRKLTIAVTHTTHIRTF